MSISMSVMKWVLPAMMMATSGLAHAASEVVACVDASRTPEAHTFYGDGAALARKVDAASINVNDRRLYLYTRETDKGAELVVFERDGEQVKVSRWKGASLGDVKERLNEVMMSNQGEHCIGKKSTDLINARFDLDPAGTRSLPRSAGELVAAEAHKGDFARVSFFLLC